MTKILTSKVDAAGIAATGVSNYSRVDKAFKLGPINMQRDHGRRAPKATHIGEDLRGDQVVFHLVVWQGQERLVDGYTRAERIRLKLTNRPSAVVVIVHKEPASDEALVALYDQFNSSAALKKATDHFDEGLRMTELLGQLQSKLCIYGQKSAAQYATGAPSIRTGVIKGEQGLRFVDQLGLEKTAETLGVLAVYYALGLHADFCAEQAEEFIRKVNQRVYKPTTKTAATKAITDFRAFNAVKKDKGTATGNANVTAIRNEGLKAFVQFMGFGLLLESGRNLLTLGDFVHVMNDARKAYPRRVI